MYQLKFILRSLAPYRYQTKTCAVLALLFLRRLLPPICTGIVIKEIHSKVPDLELAAQLEATRIANLAREEVSDKFNERIAQVEENQVLSPEVVQRSIATSLEEERRVHSKRIEDVEERVSMTRSTLQREIDELRNDAKAKAKRSCSPLNKGKTRSSRKDDKDSEKPARSRRKS